MLTTESYFGLVAIATIAFTRFFLWVKPISSPSIRDFDMHHYMYGLILIPIGILMQNVTIYAIGFGLFVDELMFVIMRGKDHKDNYSKKSLTGTTIFTGMLFLTKGFLVFPFT